jgi:hypothetical protein
MESARDEGDVRVRAVLFSNFPKEVFNNTLKPKFDQYGVEIVKVANIDRSPNVDISEADIVIAMVELMSGGQRTKIKELARRNNKRFIGLSRKGADWAKEFSSVEAASRRAAPGAAVTPPSKAWTPVVVPPPPPSEPVPETESEPQLPEPSELAEMLSLFEQENERLEERIKELEARDRSGVELELVRRLQKADDELRLHKGSIERLQMARDQQVQEVRKLKEKLAEAETKQKNTVSHDSYQQLTKKFAEATKQLEEMRSLLKDRADDTAKATTLENEVRGLRQQVQDQHQFVVSAQEQVKSFQHTINTLNEQLDATVKVKSKQAEELYRIKQENEQLRKNPALFVDDAEMKRLKNELEALKSKATMRTTEDFLKLREALATVWRLGAMTDRDVLEKLMNWQPKE